MAIEQRVAAVLRGRHVGGIDFHLGGFHVSASRLDCVAKAIEERRITIRIANTGNLLSAGYSPHSNHITLGSENAPDNVMGQASIVHECVHAMSDLYMCTQLTELSDEAAAYLTEVVFLRTVGHWVSGGAPAMAIYNAADTLAKARGLRTTRGVKLTWADYEPLRRAIHAHPAYSGLSWMQRTSGHGVPAAAP